MSIQIGTSGYSFKHWKGNFYPIDIQDTKMLDYYKEHFDVVEINSTYYTIPHQKVFFHLNNKTPDNFTFFVKLNQESTHKRNKNKESINDLLNSIDPLLKSQKLKGLLAQYPYSFKFSKDNLDYIAKTKEFCKEIPLIIEFRHNSWLKEDVFLFLKNNNITYTCVDEPRLPNLIPPQNIVTTEIGYIRFHGRNSTNWYDTSKGDRYDYLYSEKELQEWIKIINQIKDKSKILYILFNNCHNGSAPLNASMLKKLLELI